MVQYATAVSNVGREVLGPSGHANTLARGDSQRTVDAMTGSDAAAPLPVRSERYRITVTEPPAG